MKKSKPLQSFMLYVNTPDGQFEMPFKARSEQEADFIGFSSACEVIDQYSDPTLEADYRVIPVSLAH